MVDVTLNVKPHINKYLTKKYGAAYSLSKTDFLGKLIYNMLQTKLELVTKKCFKPSKFKISIPLYYFNTKGHTLPANFANNIEECLDLLFKEEMCSYIDIQVMRGCKAQVEMAAFLETYDISENDIKFESCYKIYQRHVESLTKPKTARVRKKKDA